ncbi:MAG: CoA transferase [Actinomycetota bacterium]
MQQTIGGTERLSGIRVLEIGEMVAAPYAAKLLADLGADVIKVEGPDGDPARRRGPFVTTDPAPRAQLFTPGEAGGGSSTDRDEDAGPAHDRSGLYLALNTGKRLSVVGDDTEGRTRLDALVADADIIITNYRQDQLAEIGFDPDRARADRPELVVCSITAFGRTGPYAGYRAEELTVSHGGGWAYQCPGASADVDEPPLKVFGHQTQFHAGMAAAMVCLAAYDRAERSGVGDHIDFSSMAHTAGMLEAALISASYLDEDPNRLGSRLLNPWKIFNCEPATGLFGDAATADRMEALIFLVTVEQDQWERLVALMDHPEWTKDGLFDTVELRLENEDLLVHYIEEWTRQHRVEDLWHRGQEQRVCFAPVLTMADMEGQDHLIRRGFFVDIDHPVAGTVKHLGPPFLSEPQLWEQPAPAPVLDATADPSFLPRRPRPAPAGPIADRPLEGVRVLDLSWVWAGPYCGMHLAYLGAEVIKVESAKRPGLGRRLPLHPPDVTPTLNTSAYFNQWDQGKLSVEIDLATVEGRDLVLDLVAESDVVIENFATGVLDKLGLGYTKLREVNPAIIMASISGYGSAGPLKDYMGYGPTTGPLSGLTSLTGYAGGPPRELGVSIGDPAAGITSAFAVTAALVARRISGQGCFIDTALWESTASNAVEGWMAHAMTGSQPARSGNRDPLMAPHGCYRTGHLFTEKSGATGATDEPDPGLWVTIACTDDAQWRLLAAEMDSALVTDARFSDLAARKANEDELDRLVGEWVSGQDRWDLTERLQALGIAAFPSLSTQDLLVDPHLIERGFFVELRHHEVGVRKHTGMPWISATASNEVTRPAPLIGQHTGQVLGELLGFTDPQLAELRKRGITR